jgi:tetratricopeptide (TPR) repeat protein
MDTGFVGRHRELRRIRNGFASGRHRTFIVHGLGGMGKSVLATRAATKLHKSFRGVKAVRMTATTRPEDLLSELNAFLNVAGIDAFNKILHAQAPLAAKTSVLAQILTQFPLLIIFGNFEDVLRAGQAVQASSARAKEPGKEPETTEIGDPGLAQFFEALVNSVAKGSRFIFTTRYDFDPARGHLTGEIDHIALGELPFAIAVQCMNNHHVLEGLPVSSPRRVPRPGEGALQGNTDDDIVPSVAPPITKHELYGKLGWHPYTIDVFARRASVTSVADVWLEIQGVEQEMIEFTLLDRTYAQLPPSAQILLMRASILKESPTLEVLQWLMGGTQASVSADAELKALLHWGMLSRQETKESVVYPMHALVRDYAHRQLTAGSKDEMGLLKRAGKFWDLQAKGAATLDSSVAYALRARDYYYHGGDFDKADFIVEAVRRPLMQWGQVDLLLRLTSDSIRTRSGVGKAIAMSNLAMLYHELGDLKTALQIQEEVLTIFRSAGEVRRIPVVLHEIGMGYHALGDFEKARANYLESLELAKTFSDLSGTEKYNLAMDIYQLALLDMDEGKLDDAKRGLDDSQKLFRELPDARGVAMCLRETGQIHFARAEYLLSEKRILESLDINRKIDNKQGIGHCCALLGKVFLEQGKNAEAQTAFERAISIFDSIGMRTSTADCIYCLGKIHRSEGHYQECIEKWLIAMSILGDAGDHQGKKVAAFLLQLREELGREKFDTLTRRSGWLLDLNEQSLQIRRIDGE